MAFREVTQNNDTTLVTSRFECRRAIGDL